MGKQVSKSSSVMMAMLIVFLTILVSYYIVEMFVYGHHPKRTLAYCIVNVRTVHFDQTTGSNYVWSQGEPELIGLLQQSGYPHSRPISSSYDFKAMMFLKEANDDYSYDFEYNSTTGELGSGSEWVIVPAALRSLIAKSTVPASSQQKYVVVSRTPKLTTIRLQPSH